MPISVDADGVLPIYLQIKYQMSYLINTEKLKAGARLPAVRSLAKTLGINVHTVSQAYRELQTDGLIDSSAGRGSFVRRPSDQDRIESARQERLNAILQDTHKKVRAVGFSNDEILQRMSSMLQQYPLATPVVYASKTLPVATKYAGRLEWHLQNAVSAIPLTFEDIRNNTEQARDALSYVFYVVASDRNQGLLTELLSHHETTHHLVSITVDTPPETTTALAELPARTKAVLLTEKHYRYASLNLISFSSELDPQLVEVFTSPDAEFLKAAGKADVILHTEGTAQALEEAGLAEQGITTPLLELTVDIAADSVRKLQGIFGGYG